MFFLTTSWPMTMAEWKPINGIQTQLNIDEKELDSRAFKEACAQWLGYNINNNNSKKYFYLYLNLQKFAFQNYTCNIVQ